MTLTINPRLHSTLSAITNTHAFELGTKLGLLALVGSYLHSRTENPAMGDHRHIQVAVCNAIPFTVVATGLGGFWDMLSTMQNNASYSFFNRR